MVLRAERSLHRRLDRTWLGLTSKEALPIKERGFFKSLKDRFFNLNKQKREEYNLQRSKFQTLPQ